MVTTALYTNDPGSALPPMTADDWKTVSSAELIEILLILNDCADAGDRPTNPMQIRPNRAPIECWRVAQIARAHIRQRCRTGHDGHASIWPGIELKGWR